MKGHRPTPATESPAKCGAASRTKRAILGMTVLLCSVRTVTGHDTWILAHQPRVGPGEPISLDLTSGMAFPENEAAVDPDRLARGSARLGEVVVDLSRDGSRKKALRLTARFPSPGIAMVWAESKPRSLELTPAQVREYLAEIGAWESVGLRWEAEGSGRWRESYTKHTKTYVLVGHPDQDASWTRPAGMELEIVPEKDPTRLLAGEELPVRLLRRGEPVPDLAVGLVAAGAKSGALLRSDSEGRVRLRFGTAGWWLIRATALDHSSKPDLDWETHFTTLTVFVGAK